MEFLEPKLLPLAQHDPLDGFLCLVHALRRAAQPSGGRLVRRRERSCVLPTRLLLYTEVSVRLSESESVEKKNTF